MAKVNACIWLAFELLFAGLIHSDSKPCFSCPFSTAKSTAVVKKGAAMNTFTERSDLPGVLFLAGEPSFFAWFVTSCYCFSNLKPLKSIPRSSLLDFHSLSFFVCLFLSPHCTNYHSENCTLNPLSFFNR